MNSSDTARSTRTLLRQVEGRRPGSRAKRVPRILGAPARPIESAIARTASLEECREFFLARKAELVSHLHSRPGALVELGPVCEEDQAPLIHGEFIAVRVNQISHEQLRLVEAALARLDSGEFGVCVECARPIAAQRLAAVPWASHCVACQERLDSMRGSYERTPT